MIEPPKRLSRAELEDILLSRENDFHHRFVEISERTLLPMEIALPVVIPEDGGPLEIPAEDLQELFSRIGLAAGRQAVRAFLDLAFPPDQE